MGNKLDLDFTIDDEEFKERFREIMEEVDGAYLPDTAIDSLCELMPPWFNSENKHDYVNWDEWSEEPTPLEISINMAILSHSAQRDKSGRPYIMHCLRVMSKGKNDDEKMVGVLHDVIEDTETTARELLEEGIPLHVVFAVIAISHNHVDHEPRNVYYQRIKHNPLALAVKRYDLDDNSDPERLGQLDSKTQERLKRKYREAYMALYGEVPEHLK